MQSAKSISFSSSSSSVTYNYRKLIITICCHIALNQMATAAAANKTNVISFEEGWPVLQEAIDNLIGNLEGPHTHEFTSQEYMNIYTNVYNMCVPNHYGPVPRKLYDLYKLTIEDYTTSKVLPVLRGKKDEMLLQEVVKRWKNHKVLTRWLSRFLYYIERYFITSKKLPTLKAASYLIFHNLVYSELNDQVRDAVLLMINREREGDQIDRALVKDILDIYVEMGEESMKCYEREFEEAMLKSTASFYSGIALNWITSYSYEDYMLKVEECLKEEKERFSFYLKSSSQNELLEMQNRLLGDLFATQPNSFFTSMTALFRFYNMNCSLYTPAR